MSFKKHINRSLLIIVFSLFSNISFSQFEFENKEKRNNLNQTNLKNVEYHLERHESNKRVAIITGGLTVLTTMMILDSNPNDLRLARANFIIFGSVSCAFGISSAVNYSKARKIEFQ